MSSLEEVYAGNRGRLRTALWGTLLSAGGLLVSVGFVLVTASLVAGFGFSEAIALKIAVTLTGASLLVGYLVLLARTADAADLGSVAGLGTVVALAGLALFWLTLPAGWSGDLAALPQTAVGVYAVGLLIVLGTVLAAGTADDLPTPSDGARTDVGSETESIGGVRSAMSGERVESPMSPGRDESPTVNAHTADGGTEDDDLQFFEE